jgi:4-carboxymuconolactone decarboxylase
LTSGARIGRFEPSALDAELAALREGRHAELAGRESVVARTAAALVARGDLDDAEYREAVDCIGPAGLFELLTLVGYYATLALQLRVFRVPVPEDTAPDGPASSA